MKPNQFKKIGASIIGWFANTRGKSYFDPVQTNGFGSIWAVNGTGDPANFPVLSDPNYVLAPQFETVFISDTVLPVGGALTSLGFVDFNSGPWVMFIRNSGANPTTSFRITGYPGDPANPIYAAMGTIGFSGAYVLAAGTTNAFNTILASFSATTQPPLGIHNLQLEMSATLGTTVRLVIVRQQKKTP